MEGSHRTHDLMSHRREPDLVIIIRSLSPVMGVEIENIKAGDGINFPKPGDNVKIHYTGTLKSNGTKFDSSVDRNKPFETQIGVGRVIKGWDEGVCKLSLGQEAKLIISSDYGYGASGAGGRIPPHADLVFEVKLLEINGKKAA